MTSAWLSTRRAIALCVCATVLVAAAFALAEASRADQTAASPSVALDARDLPVGLRKQESVTAVAAASDGRTITYVAFEISPAGTNTWTTFATTTSGTDNAYDATLNAAALKNGLYDLRAVATDSDGASTTSVVVANAIVANQATAIELAGTSAIPGESDNIASIGTPVSGTVTFTEIPDGFNGNPTAVAVEVAPHGTTNWTTVATGTAIQGTSDFSSTLDTTTLPDGTYDFLATGSVKAVPGQKAKSFVGGEITDVSIDNTPPSVTLSNPGNQLSGDVVLSASAQDARSGVAAVSFQAAPSGTDSWKALGVISTPPYTLSVDTAQLADGAYDLRAQATNEAGDIATSNVVAGVSVSSGASSAFGSATVTDYPAPVSDMTLLGEVAGSPSHEAWAYGFTDHPAPSSVGTPLPYTQEGNGQLVLLRYTDASGWQINDVLRNADGSAWNQTEPGDSLQVTGEMTSAGDAWIIVGWTSDGNPQIAVFHRAPGGTFRLAQDATSTIGEIFGSGFTPRTRRCSCMQRQMDRALGRSLTHAIRRPRRSTTVWCLSSPSSTTHNLMQTGGRSRAFPFRRRSRPLRPPRIRWI